MKKIEITSNNLTDQEAQLVAGGIVIGVLATVGGYVIGRVVTRGYFLIRDHFSSKQ